MFSSEAWLANSGADFYNGVATQSLRFDRASDPFLNRTATLGNRKTWTFSTWLKRSGFTSAVQYIFGTNVSNNDATSANIHIGSDNTITVAPWANHFVKTDAILRDVSAWYHIVVDFDTTQAGSGNSSRVNIYINGVDQPLTNGGATLSQNSEWAINLNQANTRIGDLYGDANELDGYLAETNFVDGLSLDASYFGETKNGVWIAKTPNVSDYGTNGFRLQFDQVGVGTASTSTIGADTSGKTNHFTSSGIVASDCAMLDSPENNFATGLGAGLSEPTNDQGYIAATWSKGNLKMTPSSAAWNNGMSNFGMTSGKWYAEAKVVNIGPNGGYTRFGMRASPTRTYDEYMWLANGNGQIDAATSPYSDRVGTYANGNVLQIALDLDNNALYFGKNGTWENSATTSEIAAGTVTNAFASGTTLIPTGDGFTYFFYFNMHGHGTAPIHIWNFGQDPSFAGEITAGTETPSEGAGVFLYAPPSGFLALASKNLPEPTIGANSLTQSTDHFGVLTYTGDGAQTRTITSGASGIGGVVDFKPDWVVQKIRSGTTQGAGNWDSTRGFAGANALDWSDSTVEGTWVGASSAAYGFVSGVDTNDVSLNDGTTATTGGYVNYNGRTYVLWNWKAGGEPTATNSAGAGNTPTAGSVKIDGVNLGSALAGSIPATKLSANTTAGFSIVTYTGTGSAGTINHGLSATPNCIIVMGRNVSNTNVYIQDGIEGVTDPFTDYIAFGDVNGVLADDATMWNDVAPDGNVFTVGTGANTNQNTKTYVAYLFSNVDGYSKFGSYTGNGDPDGTFVYTGFRPAFIMFKTTTIASHWTIVDNARSTYNVVDDSLYADTSAAELTTITDVDFLSNGFKWRGVLANETNVSGQVYIYMAFAEQPFKYANAR